MLNLEGTSRGLPRGVLLRDNSGRVRALTRENIARALTAMGETGRETVLDTMNTGYDRPIYLTGELQRSVGFETDADRQTVTWGTPSAYGPYVHEGTSRMAGRPFLRDGLLNHKGELREAAAEELKRGF